MKKTHTQKNNIKKRKQKTFRLVANCVDPDQTPRSAASDLGQRCLLRLVCLNISSKRGTSGSLLGKKQYYMIFAVCPHLTILCYFLWTAPRENVTSNHTRIVKCRISQHNLL